MSDYAQKIQKIRHRFLDSLDDRTHEIESALRSVEAGTPGAGETLHLRLHDLSGNAAMLGLDAMAQEARRGLKIAERHAGPDAPPGPLEAAEIRAAIARLLELKTEYGTTQ